MALDRCFNQGELNISRLNYAKIILNPKEDGANTLKKFRPINCSFNFFAKALNNRLEKVSDRLLAQNQTIFMKGRYILESVVFAHEIIHSTVKGKEKDLVLKLDYEKTYDKVNWDFLGKVLKIRSFGPRWTTWIMKVVMGGSISISLNNECSAYFHPGKVLR
jgi:hypothetical protein